MPVDRSEAEMKNRRTNGRALRVFYHERLKKNHSVYTTIITMRADEKIHSTRAYAGGGDTAERNNIVIGQVVYDSSFKRL